MEKQTKTNIEREDSYTVHKAKKKYNAEEHEGYYP